MRAGGKLPVSVAEGKQAKTWSKAWVRTRGFSKPMSQTTRARRTCFDRCTSSGVGSTRCAPTPAPWTSPPSTSFDRRGKGVDEIPPEPNLFCTDVDYKGVIYRVVLATHFTRHNRPQPGGKIVVTASIGGIFPHRSYPEYCGAKAAAIQFVRGVAPLLKAKENIFVNSVLPGIVSTSIVPPEMIAAVTPDCLTPVKTALDAYQLFLEDDTGMAGEVLEYSADKLIFYNLPEMGNGRVTKRAVTVWEPLFRQMYGEDSQLPDAIP
ncbi:hypothetical protein VTN77DRAFT_7672 [Rasamsonia byssochlamydoides]|uniref:uncharacterized protein n=1 Tax=Rasamsonia byssochlamydoides TaxID=89139 RepID=UPI003743B052